MAKAKKLSKERRNTVIKKLLLYIKPYKHYLVLSIISALVTTICTLVFPMFTGHAVDAITGEKSLFLIYLLVLLVLAAIGALTQYALNQSNNKLTYSIVQDIRNDVFGHIQSLPLSYLDSRSQGEVVSRIITDIDQIADGLLMGFTQFFTGVVTIIGTLICLFYINWIVALVVVLVTPISLFTASFISRRTYRLFNEQNEARGELTGFTDEMITGSKVVSAFNREEEAEKTFDQLNEKWSKAALFATFYSSLTNPVTRFVNSIVYTGVALSGGLSALVGRLTVGSLSSTLMYASQYTKPFNEISGVLTELQNALSSASRVFELLEVEEEKENPNAKVLTSVEGNIDIDHVYFGYSKNKTLIKDFNLHLKRGMKVAIVGPTGSGKTTLINLLMRFYDVDSGSVKVDGLDIQDVTRHSLRSKYGMVLQETWLKSGTIRDNLTLSNPNIADEKIDEVIKLCHLESFISTLPLGYDEPISDESGAISEGQKQLLCIARAMLSEPTMLILDEATSSIDTRTELVVQQAFGLMMEGRTSFIVAHRLSTIKKADLILVLRDGDVVEQGNHKELLEKGGFYSELYNSQFAI